MVKVTPDRPTRGKDAAGRRKNSGNTPDGSAKIKKRIRDIKRTLAKGARTAKAKVDLERQLRSLEYELGEKVIDEKERKMSVRYHQIRHVERKKVDRKLKQALRELEAETDEEEKANKQKIIDDLQVDALYVKHFPRTMKYVSLFPTEADDDSALSKLPGKSRAMSEQQNKIREEIRAVMNTHNDFSELAKKFRTEYRNRLTKRGLIQGSAMDTEDADTPSNDQADEFLEL